MENQDIVKDKEVSAAALPESPESAVSRLDNIKTAMEILYKTFPQAFVREGDPKPLKIGIINDLKQRLADQGIEGLSISKARSAVRLYTSRLRYLFNLKEGAQRVDLDGNPAGTVSAEHASYARDKFKEINDKRKKLHPRADKAKNTEDGKGRKRNFVKRGAGGAKGERKVTFTNPKAQLSDLVKGASVMVAAGKRLIRGTVADEVKQDAVTITLATGMTVSMPIDRVLLPLPPKK